MAKRTRSNQPPAKKEISKDDNLENDAIILSDAINNDTNALLKVADRLEEASSNYSEQQKGLKQMLAMQSNLKTVLSQMMNIMEDSSNPQILQSNRIESEIQQHIDSSKDDCGCDCIDASCCCFEIKLLKVRAIQAQLEPADIGSVVGLANSLEIRLGAFIENTGLVYPGLNTSFVLPVGSAKPGPWVKIDCPIKRVCLKKGTTKSVDIDFEATELDKGIERPIGFMDEYGQANGSITLDCCNSEIHPPNRVELTFSHGGTGGGRRGKIEIAYYAKRICC